MVSIRQPLAMWIVVVASVTGIKMSRAEEPKKLDSAQFIAEANRLTGKLNENSSYVSKFTKAEDQEKIGLSAEADRIESYPSDDPKTRQAQDAYARDRNRVNADRENQEKAMLRFRELATQSGQLLNGHEAQQNTDAYRALRKALDAANGWIKYHDERWSNREWRPRELQKTQREQQPSAGDAEPVPRIVGVWRGTVRQPGLQAYSVRLNITSPKRGTTEYPQQKSGGTLSGGPGGRDSYIYQEKITSGRASQNSGGAIDSTVTVRLIDDTTLSVSWETNWQGKKITASATLKKDKM
jgi:hypothetical protein